MGGLGNQMFQYAFGFALAKRKKTNLSLDISSLKKFVTPRIFELDQLCITRGNIGQKPLLAKIPKIGNRLKSFLNYFDDYFQSEKYFADCTENIRKEFQFKNKLQIPDGNTVAIHIRRGDYVKLADIHLVCTPAYYENAIDYVQSEIENPVFYVFSEDLEWVKQNISIPGNSVFVDYNHNLPSSRDMQLMSLCKHQIISNSSYSWWAAWLNQNPGKIVVAPDRWFADGRYTDIYTDYMVRVSITEGKSA
jgi:hypothetical protein